jgi:hypothetical protein
MICKTSWVLAVAGLFWMALQGAASAVDVGDRGTAAGKPGTFTVVYGNTRCLALDDGGTACSTCQGDTCIVKWSPDAKPHGKGGIRPSTAAVNKSSSSQSGTGKKPLTDTTTNSAPPKINPALQGGGILGGTNAATVKGSAVKQTTTQAR